VALTRSENMSRIRSANTKPELIVRRALSAAGFRYRLHQNTPGGKADLVMVRHKVAIFIDGCFWHGCPHHYVHPRSNWPFWDKKLRENVDRDRRQTRALLEQGWKCLRVWEHEAVESPLGIVARLEKLLGGRSIKRSSWRVVQVRPLGRAGIERREHEDLIDGAKRLTTFRERITAKTGRPGKGTDMRALVGFR
jgi:DNA mismatch endonuclease, patch repair protein